MASLSVKDRLLKSFQSGVNRVVNPIQRGLQQAELARISYGRERALGQTRGQQLVGNRVNQFLSRPIPQRLQPLNQGLQRVQQAPVMQFGAGLLQSQNLGLGRSPIASPMTPQGQSAYNRGAIVGSFNPKSITGRVVGGVVKGTNPILNKLVSPVANKFITGRLAASGANVAQGLALDKVMGRPTNALSVGVDALTGAVFGPNQFSKVRPMGKGMEQGATLKNTPIHPKDLARIEQLNEKLYSIKAERGGNVYNVNKKELNSTLNELHNLARHYLKNDDLIAIQNRAGSDTKGLIKAYKEVSKRLFERAGGIDADYSDLTMGIKGKDSLEPVYHGGAGVKELRRKFSILSPEQKASKPSSNMGLTGLSMSTDEAVARQYSRNIGGTNEVYKAFKNPEARVFEIDTKGNGIDETLNDNQIKALIKKGYDAIQDTSSGAEKEYRALTENAITQGSADSRGMAALQDSGLGMGFAANTKRVAEAKKSVTGTNQPQTQQLTQAQPKSPQLSAKTKSLEPAIAEIKQAEAIVERSLSSSGLKPPGNPGNRSLSTKVAGDKYDFNINKKRLDLDKKEQKTLTRVVKQITPELEKVKGKKLSNDEVVEAAKRSEILTKVTTREQTLDANAAMLKARQQLVELDKRITEDAMRGKPEAVAKRMKELVESLRVVSAEAADRGRKLQSLSIQAGEESVRTQVLKEVAKVETDTDRIVKEAASVDWDNAGAVAKFYRKFIKPTTREILDEFRYNNMLSNPRTQLRNAFSNLVQAAVVRPATILAGGDIKGAAQYYKGAAGAVPKATKAFVDALTGKSAINKQDLENIPTFKLPTFMTIPSRALEGMDRFFTTVIKEGEMARGAGEKEALDIAAYSLFRQDLNPKGQGKLLSAIDGLTEGVYSMGNKFPAFRWFVPFVRTPMNFAKQWIEYSPAGLATLPGAANKKEQLVKTLIGSGVTLMGAQLALEGRTTWAAPTDPKEKEYFYASGKKPFSIKVGDNWVSMQYAGPLAFALGLPAAHQYYQNESRTALTDSQLDKMGKTVSSMAEFLAGQTFLDGIDNFVSLVKGDADYTMGKNLAYTAGQFIPLQGLVRYISTIVDPVYRKASTPIEQIQSGIPYASKSLQPYTNPVGEPSTRESRNLVTPYDITTSKPEWETYQESRNKELQNNAVNNQIEKDLESGRVVKGGTKKTYTIDGTDYEGYEYDGKFNYINDDGDVTSKRLDVIEKEKRTEEKGIMEANYNLVSDRLKRKDNMRDWVELSKNYAKYLVEYQKKLDPKKDAKQIIEIQNKIEDLEASINKEMKSGGGRGKKTISDAQLLSAYKKMLDSAYAPVSTKSTQASSIIRPLKLTRQQLKPLR